MAKAGSLEIEILTNLARLTSDMAAVKRIVGTGMDGVGAGFDKARASSERYLASLEREAATIGKTSAAIKQMEIEANAMAASSAGFDDLAQKIRATGAAIDAAKADAAALAAEKDRLAAEARDAAAAEEAHANALNRLRASVDPLGAAQANVNAQMELAATAFARGEMQEEEYLRTTQVLTDRLEDLKMAQERANGSMGTVGKTATLTKAQMLNLGFQVQDLGIQMMMAAQSSSPMRMAFTALIQQGAQIQGIGAQAGIGFGGMAKAAIGMIASVSKAALLNPIFLGIAAAVGVAYGAFKYFQGEVKKSGELERYAKSLGMTKEQIEKAGGAGVTFGDVLKGVWKTVSDGLGLDKVFKGIGEWASDAFGKVLSAAKTAAAWLYGGFVGAYRTIIATWKLFPAAIGELFINATNLAIDAINKLIAATISGINWMAQQANQFIGVNLFGQIGDFAIEPLKNAYAGAGKEIGSTFVDEVTKGVKEGKDGLDAAGDTLWKNIVGAGQARLKAAKDADKAKPKVDKHAEALLREFEATEAAIKGLYDLASAYGVSDAAAMKAEATAQAIEKAIRKRGDQEIFVAQALRKAVAERVAAGAKAAADANFQAAAQEAVNKQVAAGTLTTEKAADALALLVEQRSLLAAIDAATQNKDNKGLEEATKALNDLTAARIRETKAKMAAQAAGQRQAVEDEIAAIELEVKLLGASNRERAVAVARLKAEQEARAMTAADAAKHIENAVRLANAEEDAREKTHSFNESLLDQVRLLELINDRAGVMADTLSSAFGRVGTALGGIMTEMTAYSLHQAKLDEERKRRLDEAGDNAVLRSKVEMEMDAKSKTAQMQHYGALLSTAKTFFKEGTTGYKVLSAAEKAFAIVQMANTAINVAAGAAKMFSMLGPFAFPAIAAMIAVMAALGFGGGGGATNYKPPTAEETQAAQGAGSVLGDSEAKSGSIANSLALMLKNTNKDLEYSNEMVRSLRAIETNIGVLTNQLARQLGVTGGDFDTSGFGLGSSMGKSTISKLIMAVPGMALLGEIPVIGGLVSGIVKALFGTKKTVTLLDQGLTFAAQSVQDIINNGAIGQIYSDIQTQTKKKFFGITTSNKTKVTTEYGALDNDMERQVALIIGSLRAGVLDAAGVLGVDGAQAALDAFTVNIGRISLKDLTGEEIQQQLEAVFSKLGDDMAKAALPGLEAFQRVGEGVFETLARLAKDYATIDTALKSIGMTFGAVGMASVEARENLIDLFGGLDAFAEQTQYFRENFLTEAEQMAPVITAVRDEMARLGVSGINTIEQFKTLVLGLNLSTEGGQEMYASLMAVAPAFHKVTQYLGSLDTELEETGKTAAELAAIAKQARSLDIQLMEALGDTAGALAAKRADELAALDESLRAKQLEVWAAQDAAEASRILTKANEDAAEAVRALAEKRGGLEIQIMELEGNAVGALAAKRAIELAALDESLRPLQERIYALEDERTAIEAAAEATRVAQEIANTRRSLEIEIMRLLGDENGALAATRADELAALDPSLRVLKERIYALEDERDATIAATEAANAAREVAKTGRDMEIRIMELSGNAVGALAARRAIELAALDPSLHALQLRIYALEDEKTATDAVTEALRNEQELLKTRRSMEIELMRALGDESGALAAQRELELAALDPSLHALQRAIWTAQDATAAQDALATAQANAARTAQEIANLNIRLLEAQGNDTAALAARRQLELSQATDDATRALLREIYAAEDATAIRLKNEAIAKQAEQDAEAAAREAKQAAEEAARRTAEIANQRASLEIELMRALGNESGALAAERERELAGMDASLHALQQQVWSAQDAAKAQAELAKAQEEAAAKAEQLAKDRLGLQIRILELEGNTVAATALKRQQELAALDESLRPLQLRIYALEDAKIAEEAHAAAVKAAADKVAQARDTLRAAYDREAGALRDTVDRFTAFSTSLRDFRASLVVSNESVFDVYRRAQAKFVDTASAARLGDEKALGGLADAGKAFLDASRNRAGSLAEYQRDVARVAKAVDAGIGAADREATIAAQSLDRLTKTVSTLIDIKDEVVSIVDAIDALHVALEEEGLLQTPQALQVPAGTPESTPLADTTAQAQAMAAEMSDMRVEMRAGLEAVATNTGGTYRLLNRAIREDAFVFRPDEDAGPLTVTGDVRVINTTANPVPVDQV